MLCGLCQNEVAELSWPSIAKQYLLGVLYESGLICWGCWMEAD
jgi:hypothetical protein